MNNIFYLFPLLIVAALVGNRFHMLTKLGAIGTILVGLAVMVGFDIKGLILLGAFFISSSFWSAYKKEKKKEVEDKLEKSAGRDIVQIFANGGVAAVAGILYYSHQDFFFLAMFISSIAAANSDTWASELGVLSKSKPFLLLSFKETDPGTSGAVSPLGLFASLAGAFIISVLGVFLFQLSVTFILLFTFIGFLGSLIDTILGALVQRTYRCNVCGLETEKKIHCNTETIHAKGSVWISNDTVNLLSILLASLVGGFVVM
jgi:uncharacterized protein (TIGR00297 family)